MYHYKLFYHVEIFRKKRFLVDVKPKYFLLETKMRGVETKWRETWWRHRGRETVSRGLEVILQIWRFGGHFCGDHGASAPPPYWTHCGEFYVHNIYNDPNFYRSIEWLLRNKYLFTAVWLVNPFRATQTARPVRVSAGSILPVLW